MKNYILSQWHQIIYNYVVTSEGTAGLQEANMLTTQSRCLYKS